MFSCLGLQIFLFFSYVFFTLFLRVRQQPGGGGEDHREPGEHAQGRD